MPNILPLLWLQLQTAWGLPQQLDTWPPSQGASVELGAKSQQLAVARDPGLAGAHIDLRAAGLGHTALVYRQQHGLRSAQPELVVRFDSSGTARILAYRPTVVEDRPHSELKPAQSAAAAK